MGALDWLEDKATEVFTGRDLDQERAAAAAAAAGNVARSVVYGQQSQLRSDLPYGTDPATITTVDNWASWSHPQIKAMTDQLDSGTMHSTAQGWDTRGKALETDFSTFKSEMAQIVTAGWEGEAATAAQSSTSSYADTAASVGTAARYMGTKITEAATGAEQTRSMVPEPVSFSVKEGLLSALGGPLVVGADVMKQKNAQTEAHAAAVQVLTSVYTPVYQQSDAGIPSFGPSSGTGTPPGASTPSPTPPASVVPPSNPGVPGAPAGGVAHHGSWNPYAPSPTGLTTGLSWSPGSGAPSGPSSSGPPPSGPSGPVAWSPGAPPTSGSNPSPWPVSGGSSSTPAPVSSAGWTPPGSAAGSVGGSSGYGFGGSTGSGPYGYGAHGPGSYGSGGAGGYGSGGTGGPSAGYGSGAGLGAYASGGRAGGSAGGGYRSSGYGGGGSSSGGYGSGGTGGYGSGSGSAAGAGGRVGAGGATATGGGAATGSATSGAAGGRSAGGGGMAGGGRGAKGEEDFEHNTPSYLITEENGSELVGELPKVAPAVIGE
jgi:hypothetical protein